MGYKFASTRVFAYLPNTVLARDWSDDATNQELIARSMWRSWDILFSNRIGNIDIRYRNPISSCLADVDVSRINCAAAAAYCDAVWVRPANGGRSSRETARKPPLPAEPPLGGHAEPDVGQLTHTPCFRKRMVVIKCIGASVTTPGQKAIQQSPGPSSGSLRPS